MQNAPSNSGVGSPQSQPSGGTSFLSEAAGLADGRENGCHAMRHTYASTLVARGVDPRTAAEYLGHSDGGALVLRTYSHLMPDAEDRARRAIEDALADAESAINGPSTAPGQEHRS